MELHSIGTVPTLHFEVLERIVGSYHKLKCVTYNADLWSHAGPGGLNGAKLAFGKRYVEGRSSGSHSLVMPLSAHPQGTQTFDSEYCSTGSR